MCDKVAYTSERKAKIAMRRLRSGDRLRVYLCKRCKFYHFTSQIGEQL